MHQPKPGVVTFKSLKTGQFAVNDFTTSSLLICKVDILHYWKIVSKIDCYDRKPEVIEEYE